MDSGTRVVVTIQVAALDGHQVAGGYREGWATVLECLAAEIHSD